MTGTLLAGRYRLGRLLGRGGMSEVRSAYDELAGHTVAVKLFHAYAEDPGQVARRDAEGRITEELDHPGVVKVLDAGTDGARAYLVMELVMGSTLEELSAGGPLPVDQIADLGTQLADTLARVHAAGIVHRDVKPSNVLLASAGRGRWETKLTDFGISRKVDGTRLTSTGLLVGTARYLSPEQAAGEPVSVSSDVYSLGLVLLECLTGEKPYPGTLMETTVARLTRAPDIPSSLGPIGELLAQMTARRPSDRPGMEEVATRLRELADVEADDAEAPFLAMFAPVGEAAAEAAEQPAAGRRRPLRRALVAAAATVALATSLTGLLGGDPSEQATAIGDGVAGNITKVTGGDDPVDAPPEAPNGAQAVGNEEQPVTRQPEPRGPQATEARADRPERPAGDRPRAGQAGKPRSDRPRADRPKAAKPKAAKPRPPRGPKAGKPKADKPKADKPRPPRGPKADKPNAPKPKAGKPRPPRGPKADKPKPNKAKAKADKPKPSKRPKADRPRGGPQGQGKANRPKTGGSGKGGAKAGGRGKN